MDYVLNSTLNFLIPCDAKKKDQTKATKGFQVFYIKFDNNCLMLKSFLSKRFTKS